MKKIFFLICLLPLFALGQTGDYHAYKVKVGVRDGERWSWTDAPVNITIQQHGAYITINNRMHSSLKLVKTLEKKNDGKNDWISFLCSDEEEISCFVVLSTTLSTKETTITLAYSDLEYIYYLDNN